MSMLNFQDKAPKNTIFILSIPNTFPSSLYRIKIFQQISNKTYFKYC